jgi:hypothetical protein
LTTGKGQFGKGGDMLWLLVGLAALALLALLGQYLAGQADIFVSIANPRPLDEEQMEMVVNWWGLSFRTPQPFIAMQSDHGLCDVRIFSTRRQMLVSIATLGWKRPVTIAWRGHAGIQPLGRG